MPPGLEPFGIIPSAWLPKQTNFPFGGQPAAKPFVFGGQPAATPPILPVTPGECFDASVAAVFVELLEMISLAKDGHIAEAQTLQGTCLASMRGIRDDADAALSALQIGNQYQEAADLAQKKATLEQKLLNLQAAADYRGLEQAVGASFSLAQVQSLLSAKAAEQEACIKNFQYAAAIQASAIIVQAERRVEELKEERTREVEDRLLAIPFPDCSELADLSAARGAQNFDMWFAEHAHAHASDVGVALAVVGAVLHWLACNGVRTVAFRAAAHTLLHTDEDSLPQTCRWPTRLIEALDCLQVYADGAVFDLKSKDDDTPPSTLPRKIMLSHGGAEGLVWAAEWDRREEKARIVQTLGLTDEQIEACRRVFPSSIPDPPAPGSHPITQNAAKRSESEDQAAFYMLAHLLVLRGYSAGVNSQEVRSAIELHQPMYGSGTRRDRVTAVRSLWLVIDLGGDQYRPDALMTASSNMSRRLSFQPGPMGSSFNVESFDVKNVQWFSRIREPLHGMLHAGEQGGGGRGGEGARAGAAQETKSGSTRTEV